MSTTGWAKNKTPDFGGAKILLQKIGLSETFQLSLSVELLLTPTGLFVLTAPTEPLLCKFADGGQKKRQNQSKYTQNGRPWPREGEVSYHT